MSIFNYLKSLLPTFGKDRILEDLRLSRTEFQDFRLAFKEADKVLGKLKSKQAQELGRVASNLGLSLKGGESIVGFLSRNQENIIDNIDLMERLVKQEMPDTVAAQGLDLRQINFVQISEVMSFSARFSRFLVSYLTRLEFDLVAEDKKLEVSSDVMPYEHEAFEKGMMPFIVAMIQLSKPVTEVQEALASIPDMLVADTNYNVLKSTLGEKKIEPLGLTRQDFEWNPIYHIRMNLVEGRELRYRECKAQLSCLQLQLARNRLAAQGKQDARLEREIAYLTNMINNVNSEIADLT